MYSKFAIFDLGISANVAKPVAVALAVCGSIAAPGATVDNPVQSASRSDPGVPLSSNLIIPAVKAVVADDVVTMAHGPTQAGMVMALSTPAAMSGAVDAIRHEPVGSERKSLLRQVSAFTAGFAGMQEPETQSALVEQVLGPETVTTTVAPPAEAESATASPIPAHMATPMNLAQDKAPKMADLTAFEPMAKPVEHLAGAKAEADLTATSGTPAIAPAAPAVATAVTPAIAFVANPVVQPLAPAHSEPAGLIEAAPAKAKKPEREDVAPSASTAKPRLPIKTAAPATVRIPGVEAVAFSIDTKPETKGVTASKPSAKLVTKSAPAGKPGYRLNNDVIDFALPARLNGENVGTIPLRVTRDDRLWVRLGDLLTMVRPQMSPDQFERLSGSAAANEYLNFEAVRRAGIALRYDAARNRIDLGEM